MSTSDADSSMEVLVDQMSALMRQHLKEPGGRDDVQAIIRFIMLMGVISLAAVCMYMTCLYMMSTVLTSVVGRYIFFPKNVWRILGRRLVHVCVFMLLNIGVTVFVYDWSEVTPSLHKTVLTCYGCLWLCGIGVSVCSRVCQWLSRRVFDNVDKTD